MKFDIVIGNPPYNNDIYLDFVTLGNSLSNEYTCMITPAKWQGKSGIKNIAFRDNILPYITNIVVYRDSTEIFDIEEWGGICYYLVGKEISNEKLIKNICKRSVYLNSNEERHSEKDLILYPNQIVNIINKAKSNIMLCEEVDVRRQIFIGEQDRGRDAKYTNNCVEVMQGELVVGYKDMGELFNIYNVDKWKCISSIMAGASSAFDKDGKILMPKLSILKPYQVPKGSFPVLVYFDTLDECNSFISYMNTKFISFLYYLGCCGTTLTREFFRFIPLPDQGIHGFNHIFTDKELYDKYKLRNDEIDIIESLIRGRKNQDQQ